MWTVKTFKTLAAMRAWIDRNAYRVEFREVFINNGYAVDYRPLRRIG
jgi:hypothetical protein